MFRFSFYCGIEQAHRLLKDGPIFQVLPLRDAKVGILVTGSDVFKGLVKDRCEPIITDKVRRRGCTVTKSVVVPDDNKAIKNGIKKLILSGSDLIVITAGLSVDPDDMTYQGIIDAGAEDILYGAPILPGAMTLPAEIGKIPIMGVPSCFVLQENEF